MGIKDPSKGNDSLDHLMEEYPNKKICSIPT